MTRHRVLPVLVAIACAALAAVVMQASEPAQDYDVSPAVLGRPAALDDGQVLLTGIRLGSRIDRGPGTELRTAGLFVVVDLTLTAGDKTFRLGTADLVGSGRTYKPYSLFSVATDPGFQTATSVVFEVDPAHLSDLTFTVREAETLRGYQQRVVAPLGITDANVERWRASAEGRSLDVVAYPVQVPVR